MANARELLLVLMLGSSSALGAEATTWHYAVDASLAYADGVGRPAAVGVPTSAGGLAGSVKEPTRALGLKRFRLELGLTGLGGARLFAALRPDAANRMSEGSTVAAVHDYDARACSPRDPDKDRMGGCYRRPPTVRMLDAYHLAASPAESLEGAVGVFEGLEHRRTTYEAPLGFGLAVRLPSKFSALRLAWRNRRPTLPSESSNAGDGLSGDLYALQGDEERIETLASRDGTYDTAPVAQDPYYGGAGGIGWRRSGFAVGLVGGHQQGAATDGRRNEVYGQLFTAYTGGLGTRPFRVNLDLRLSRESWRVSGPNVSDRTQQSVEISTVFGVTGHQRLLAGLGYGTSDRPAALTRQDELMKLSGYQFELGAGSDVAPGLEAILMLSHERRRAILDGSESGGFFDEDGARSTLRRIGLELAYRLDGNT